MDTEDIEYLRTPDGVAVVAAATALLATTTEVTALRRLTTAHGADHARAAVALVRGRTVAAGKFEDGARLFCDHEAAEQASDELVARHLAARFTESRYVTDIGCGMGGDALAIAAAAPEARVVGIDLDPARLAMLEANAEVRGVAERVTPLLADASSPSFTLPKGGDAAWCDPARRTANGRQLRPEAWSPSLARALELTTPRDTLLGAGVKLAPGIDTDLLPAGDEVEFVSLGRTLRAAVLWRGTLARADGATRTATVLPAAVSLAGAPEYGRTELRAPGAYLYDPDPTVGRAGLIWLLAEQLGAWQLDTEIAYVSSDVAVETPFARRLLVRACLPFAERRLLEVLREVGAARVEVTRRGSPVDTNALERRLNAALRPRDGAQGGPVAVVALTRLDGVHVAIVCEREERG